MMKRILLTVCLCAASCVSAFSPEELVPALEKGLAPFRKHDIQLERMEDPVIAQKPFMFFHIIFSREYISGKDEVPLQQTPDQATGKVPVRQQDVVSREYADFVIIPKSTSFNLKNALRFSTENHALPAPDTYIYFGKYGFRWRKLKSSFEQYTLYLGEDQNNYYFGHASLPVLVWFNRALGLKDGFPVLPTLAAALEVDDKDQFTCRYAIAELAKSGNEALPHLQNAVESILEMDMPPVTPFIVMKLINTPEADAMLSRYAADRRKLLLQGLFQAFEDFTEMRAAQKKVFLRMLTSRMAPLIGLRAAVQLNLGKEFIPALKDYVARPYSFAEYSMGVRYTAYFRNPELRTVHENAAGEIRMLLLRNGDIPNTLRVINVDEKAVKREDRLAQEDQERIKPYVNAFLTAPETDLGILYALDLATFSPKEKGVKNTYIQRVRNTGVDILKKLPEAQVKTAFQSLLRYLVNPVERDLFDSAFRSYLRTSPY